MLRELKELVKQLVDMVENTVSKITATLEALWSKIVTANYIIAYNDRQKTQAEVTNGLVQISLNDYMAVVKKIKSKTAERKKLLAEKDKLNPLQLIQKSMLTKLTATFAEDISELDLKRKSLLGDIIVQTIAK